MSPVMAALMVGGLATLGKWSNNKSLEIGTIVGILGMATVLALINQGNEELASALGILAVVGTGIAQLPNITKKLSTIVK